jgi:hypothetical protein
MLEARVEELKKQLEKDFTYSESLMARLVGFMRYIHIYSDSHVRSES